jgi:hypothetical protein
VCCCRAVVVFGVNKKHIKIYEEIAMKDQKLMTLKQIADQIRVNYRTLVSCKNRFEGFVHGVPVGRIARYPEDFVDFFRLVFALFDEGYTTGKVQDLLLNGVESEEDAFIESWLEEWRVNLRLTLPDDEGEAGRTDDGMTERTDERMDERMDGLPDGSMDGGTDGGTDERTDGLLDEGMNGRTDGRTDESMNGRMDEGTDELMDGRTDGPMNGGTDGPTDGWTDEEMTKWLDERMKPELQNLRDQTQLAVLDILRTYLSLLEEMLQKSTTQTNIAITALCESTQDIRNGLLSINDRLSRLERDLDVEAAEPLEIYEVDARNYQVDLPEISLPDMTSPSTVDLEPGSDPGSETAPEYIPSLVEHDLTAVRDSIDNGIPDRDVLVDWAMEKRQQDENTYSYNVLARILNESAIPTMSGRGNWSRSTVRNLLVRTLKNRE